MNRDEIIAANPIEQVIRAHGIELKPAGKGLVGLCPFHEDHDPSFTVTPEAGLWCCHGCGRGGSVIDFVSQSRGITIAEAMRELSGDAPQSPSKPPPPPAKPASGPKPPLVEVCAYEYQDALGNVVYQALRYEPKTFKQRHWAGAAWVWGMAGVEKVLYHFPEVMAADRVFVCEGEKDADSVRALGYCATTNIGGSGAWLDGYAGDLRDKTVMVVPDNDAPGKKWAESVIKSLENQVAETLLLTVPAPHNDITEYLDEFGEADAARAGVDALVDGAQVFTRGLRIPIYNMAELEVKYRQFVKQSSGRQLDLARWLPALQFDGRPLWPGETVVIIGDTGIGKTAIMQNIAMCIAPLPVLIFELELPEEMMFERTAALTSKEPGHKIEEIYKAGGSVQLAGSEHIWVCPQSGLSVPQIGGYTAQAELKMGVKPAVLGVDYLGLIAGEGKRYERTTDSAQGLKVLAKTSRTIIVEIAMIHRKLGQAGMPVELHDAKDSGDVENSAGCVLGCWRDREDRNIGYVKVLKWTKGIAGRVIKVRIDFPRITQLEPDYKIES